MGIVSFHFLLSNLSVAYCSIAERAASGTLGEGGGWVHGVLES